VIPIDTQELPAEAWQNLEVFIESPALRPVADPYYLDPGPLSHRQSADLIWTGEEMIVWGGKTMLEGLPTLVDGAAFDPVTDEWRMIAPFPLEGPRASRAILGDGEMLVVNHENVFGYNYETDSWRVIADGMAPSESHDQMLFVNGRLFVWIGTHEIRELTLATGEWRVIPAPEPGGSQGGPYFNVLRSVNGEIFALILPGGRCFGKDLWQLSDDDWLSLPEPSDAGNCSLANQVAAAGGELVVWDEEGHPVVAYSNDIGEWRELPTVPLGGAEGASGPIPMDDDHFTAPNGGEGAIFDAMAGAWTPFQFPGIAYDQNTIWTGTEFLSWGLRDQTFDAWRFTPPSGFAIGDNT
jgi:hypothetical protein